MKPTVTGTSLLYVLRKLSFPCPRSFVFFYWPFRNLRRLHRWSPSGFSEPHACWCHSHWPLMTALTSYLQHIYGTTGLPTAVHCALEYWKSDAGGHTRSPHNSNILIKYIFQNYCTLQLYSGRTVELLYYTVVQWTDSGIPTFSTLCYTVVQ